MCFGRVRTCDKLVMSFAISLDLFTGEVQHVVHAFHDLFFFSFQGVFVILSLTVSLNKTSSHRTKTGKTFNSCSEFKKS